MPTKPPPPVPSPGAPGPNNGTDKLSTGEFVALQAEALREDKKRSPASHWDVVKSNTAILGTLCAIVLGFIAFGDRVVARAESKTADGMKETKAVLKQHVDDSRVVHSELLDATHEMRDELKESRADMKALYRAMPSRRSQRRLEVDVIEPEELEFRVPAGPVQRDGGR